MATSPDLSTTHRLMLEALPACPKCGTLADGATGGREAPKPADLSVCFYCYAVLEYVAAPGGLALRTFTAAEVAALPEDTRSEIKTIIKALKNYRAK